MEKIDFTISLDKEVLPIALFEQPLIFFLVGVLVFALEPDLTLGSPLCSLVLTVLTVLSAQWGLIQGSLRLGQNWFLTAPLTES